MPEARPGISAKVERNLFVLCVLLAVLGLGAYQPVFWNFNFYCWDTFLVVAALYHLYKAIVNKEWPPLNEHGSRPFPTNYYCVILCLSFLGRPPVLIVIMPEWILAIYGAVAYAGSHFGGTRLWQRYGTTLQLYLLAYQEYLLTLCAALEITAGFLLPLFSMLLPQYYLMRAILYCRLHLPIRFSMPESAAYHKKMWEIIAVKTSPLLQAVPVLNIPVNYVKSWFNFELVQPEHIRY
ncbi:g2551 [Coccomyxa viridis]|uniref:G2551 protein n=1 Tax=Coccomyxa viridis TaxID=1274662 RepID=A0ABP1FPC5_9CHLO